MPEEKEEKKTELRELQNRIMELEISIKGMKGAEAEAMKAIAREEIKTIADELAALKTPKILDTKKEEGGLFDWLPDLF